MVVHSGYHNPLLLAGAYAALIPLHWEKARADSPRYRRVSTLPKPVAPIGGWAHYLAFDLFIGTWGVRDSVQHKLPQLLVVPC